MAQRPLTDPGVSLGPQQLANLLDSTQEVIAILAADGTVLFANSTFQPLLGYRADELLGRSFYAILHTQDVDAIRSKMRVVVGNAEGTASERSRIRGKDGAWKWLEI